MRLHAREKWIDAIMVSEHLIRTTAPPKAQPPGIYTIGIEENSRPVAPASASTSQSPRPSPHAHGRPDGWLSFSRRGRWWAERGRLRVTITRLAARLATKGQ